MKRRMRPIADALDQAVLHWIDVAIFDMAGVVRFVPDQMFPEPSLPYPAFVASDPNGTEPFQFRQRSRKAALNKPPAAGEIGITSRQGPDSMHMIGQHDNGVDPEREFLLRPDDRVAQGTDMFDQQSFSPLQHIYGEEPAAAWNECTTIIGHETRISHHQSVLANPLCGILRSKALDLSVA